MKLCNGRWETAKFNNRMQVTELGLGASASDVGTWKTQYEYGELNSNGTVDTSKNTGNIAKQTLSFNGITHPLVQSYRYDALYRIIEAAETANTVANWFQVWGYDRYGNRTSFTQNIGGNPASSNPTIDTNTNRFSINQGFAYDKNGNVTSNVDPMTSQARTFLFNADNKQYEVKNAFGATIARYYYDGEGKRVKKKVYDPNNPSVVSEETIFVYSSGKLVAEYSTSTPPATPTVNYTTTDHLGSPRVITDAIGQVTSRRDFLPFGEEVTINVGARSTALKYGSFDDKVRQKFTGYQKDTETSLHFAEARMYDNRFGRFTAVDPLLASGKSANPQTFNRFAYAGNNPVLRIDPTGEDWYVAFNYYRAGGKLFVRSISPVWHDSNPGSRKWGTSGSIVDNGFRRTFNASWAFFDPDTQRYIAIDRFEPRKPAEFGTLEAAQAQVKAWSLQSQVNFVAGYLSGTSFIFELSGAAKGMKAETSSEMFALGQRVGTGGSLTPAGGGLVGAVANKFGKGGMSIVKGLHVAEGGLSQFTHAGKFGFESYSANLTAVHTIFGKGNGKVEVHHLIEKRFAGLFGQNTSEMLSIVLTKAEHAAFNRAWLDEIGRDGMKSLITTSTATRADVEAAARKIYANHPEILKKLGL